MHIVPSINLRHPILSCATAIRWSCGACRQISSKDFIPQEWANSTTPLASSGSVSDSNNHFSQSLIICINASTCPILSQWRIWLHISFTMQQLGHLSLRPSVHLARKPFVAVMPMTCLHAQSWNILGTSSRAAETYFHVTRSNCSESKILQQLKTSWAICLYAQNLSRGQVSEVIFSIPTKQQIGPFGKHCCRRRTITSAFKISCFALASTTQFSCAGWSSRWKTTKSSWHAFTWQNSHWNVKSPQLTRIGLRTLECLQRVGILPGGSKDTRPKAPRQSE